MKPHIGWMLAIAAMLAPAAAIHAAPRALLDTSSRVQQPRLAMTNSSTCFVTAEGAVYCWGAYRQGQLGIGYTHLVNTLSVTTVPLRASTPPGVVSIVAGRTGYYCALTNAGRVYCWGNNSRSQGGIPWGDAFALYSPTLVPNLEGVVQLSAGDAHTCAVLIDGSARCWGQNLNGQLGGGFISADPPAGPVTVATTSRIVAIDAGVGHTCALIADGTAQCWGANSYGMLGNGSITPSATPVVVSGLQSATAIVAGDQHSCALLADGTVRCWGSGDGVASEFTNFQYLSPVPVDPRLPRSRTIVSRTSADTCVTTATGTVWCWGTNGTRFPRRIEGLEGVLEVATSGFHSCALSANERVRCWGENDDGELGDGTRSNRSDPVIVPAFDGSITARTVTAGRFIGCAGRSNGTVACWGALVGRTTPNPETIAAASNVLSVRTGSRHSCAVRANGSLACWGLNANGQLGTGNDTSTNTANVVGGLTEPMVVAPGGRHTCALTADGRVSCWGESARGQIGVGPVFFGPDRLTPVAVVNVADAVGVASGSSHSCALLVNGQVTCWGANDQGQLGDGTFTDRSLAVTVRGLTDAVALGVGGSGNHTCAIRATGTAVCWGNNTNGQLGDGTTVDRATPVPVANLTRVTSISTGTNHTCAVTLNELAYCWGSNGSLQLGTASLQSRSTPGQVVRQVYEFRGVTYSNPLDNVRAISAGATHTCSLSSSGAPYCWGNNSFGEIGDGSTTERALPVAVPSFTANVLPEVQLGAQGRTAIVTVLLNCPEGARAHVTLELDQDGTSGARRGSLACTGALEKLPFVVPMRAPESFRAGPGMAFVEASVETRGEPLIEQQWTRAVTLSEAQ